MVRCREVYTVFAKRQISSVALGLAVSPTCTLVCSHWYFQRNRHCPQKGATLDKYPHQNKQQKGGERDQGKRVRRKKESFLALLTQPTGGSLKTLSCFVHFSLAQVGLPQQELSRVHLREDKHIHHSNIVLVCVCMCVCVCVSMCVYAQEYITERVKLWKHSSKQACAT